MKQMPASSSALSWRSAGMAMSTPSSLSTSAVPDFEDSARLPCLATFRPPPAATKPTAVETFRVCWPSPPVPQTSMVGNLGSMWTAARRMARAQATISPRVSPRIRIAVSAAPTWLGVGSPRRQAAKNSPALSSESVPPSASRLSKGLKASDMGAGSGVHGALDAGDVEEVGQQLVAAFRSDGFRMELHAVHRARAVLHAHDLAVLGPGGDLQLGRQHLLLDRQAVIARRREGVLQAG